MASATTDNVYPLSAVRALALHAQCLGTQCLGAQGLTTPPGKEPLPTLDAMHNIVRQLGCVQIDTLQMVQRSQYLVMWSRLGVYDPADFDRLAYDPNERRLFEYWKHAASLIPLEEYRYQLPLMRWFRDGNHHWNSEWLEKPGSTELVAAVHERISQEGALRASDFEHDGGPRGTWWDWKPAKQALEYLYNTGTVMIADRVNFQRAYDLKERVLPDWVDTREPSDEERDRFRLQQALKALGVCEPAHVADYAGMKRTSAKSYLQEMLDDGIARQIQARLMDGQEHSLIVHSEQLDALERATSGEIVPQRTTFLSPFDSLFWARGRDELFWGFRQTLEAYKPKPDRIWGYFCLPILHGERLVGRFDPKLERKDGRLILRALYLEPETAPTQELVAEIAQAMGSFMQFHQASDLVIEKSQPESLGAALLARM